MKTMMLLGVMVLLVQASPVLEADPATPLLGSWALDLEHSQVLVEGRPKSVTITYKDVGGG
jgi:hypothetical protein